MTDYQKTTIRVSGTDQNGTAANAAMTSDILEIIDNSPWTLSVWNQTLTPGALSNPRVTIEVSNENNADSMKPLTGAINKELPAYFEKNDSKWRYFRLVYSPEGATAGTKHFKYKQEI